LLLPSLAAGVGSTRLSLESSTDAEQIAAREKCSIRQVNMTISLAFLSPTLVIAAIDGTLPRGVGVGRLRDAPAEWSNSTRYLGSPSKHERSRFRDKPQTPDRAGNGFPKPRDKAPKTDLCAIVDWQRPSLLAFKAAKARSL
jgi:hypothetical protein